MYNKYVSNFGFSVINNNIASSSLYKSFVGIWFGHLILDFMLGVWPAYKTLAGIDFAIAGLIGGIGMFMGESSQLFFGFLSDRGYHRILITVGIVLTSCISFIACTDNYLILLILMILTYLGSGAFHPAAAGMVGSWSSTRKGLFLMLFASGGLAGAAMSQGVFAAVYNYFKGNTLIFLVPVICLGVWFYFHSFPPQRISTKCIDLQRVLKWIKPHRRELILLYIAQVFMQSVMASFVFLLPDVLFIRGYDQWFCLGGAHCCFIMGAALMSVPAGHFSDKYSYRSVLMAAVLFSVLFFYFFLLAGSFSHIFTGILLFVMGGCMGIINPLIVAAGNRLVPVHASSIISAFLMGAASCMAGLGIVSSGLMASSFFEEPTIKALEVMGGLYLVSIFLIFKMQGKRTISNEGTVPILVR